MSRNIRAKPEGTVTRGTTAPNRLRRVDRWVAARAARLLRTADHRPLVVDLGFGASPVTTVELYERLRTIRPDIDVVGLEIDPARVEQATRFLAGRRGSAASAGAAVEAERYEGLYFGLGGFELPVARPPLLVRAFNVLRQYGEAEAWRAWDRICTGLGPGGLLVEGTCDEIGRRSVWVTLGRGGTAVARPLTITFAARAASLPCPSALAERLPKTLIHRNVPGEAIHRFLSEFDRAWAVAAPQSVFGPRARWVATVEYLARDWPVLTRPPSGGRGRWRLGEVTLPWEAVAPEGR